MFSNESILFYGKKAIKISSPQQSSSMIIIPEQGGIVASLILGNQERMAQVQSENELEENPWGKSVLLYPFPNRLKSGVFIHENRRYKFPINDRNTGNALHGFGANEAMSVSNIDLKEDAGSLTLNYSYDGRLEYYPWSFDLSITYSLTKKGFELQMEVSNTSTESYPFGFGWHPYFLIKNAGSNTALKLPKGDQIDIDEFMIPTGKRQNFAKFSELSKIADTQFDTGFELQINGATSSVILSNEEEAELKIWQESGPDQFRFLQVFIPPDRNSIALEPMTCNIDAFNNKEGVWLLEPGEKRSLRCGVGV